jgi:type VI secretion system protein ImpE
MFVLARSEEMTAQELFQAGQIDKAIETLGAEIRSTPTDAKRRTFLFELLCFAGSYDRAEKQLDVLGQGTQEAAMGMLLYRSALHGERTRQDMFRAGRVPIGGTEPRPVSGTLNGKPFNSLTDADPRIGARLEVIAAGQYMWIPFEQLASVKLAPPKRLRDLMWATALVRPGAGYTGAELGELLLPVLAPLTWDHADGAVRLGRVTEWQELDGGGQAPVGQKLLLVDEEELPILEVRELEITPASSARS